MNNNTREIFHQETPLWLRKLRKLKRNPYKFFVDAKIFRMLYPKLSFLCDKYFIRSHRTEKSDTTINNSFLSVADERFKFFTNINNDDSISFTNVSKKNHRLVTRLLFSDNIDDVFIDELRVKLSQWNDFDYTHYHNLQVGVFSDELNVNRVTLLHRISYQNKVNLSAVNYLILLDPPAELCSVLRSSFSDIYLIAVFTKEPKTLDYLSIDCLLVNNSIKNISDRDLFRKFYDYSDINHLALTLRKIIQEANDKKPDMLLPLYNENRYQRESYLNFNNKQYQGKVLIRKNIDLKFETHEQFVGLLAAHVVSIAVVESVYLKYKNYCENIEQDYMIKRLVSMILYDGGLLDIEYV